MEEIVIAEDFGASLQPRLDSERGYTQADTEIGADVDTSLRNLLNAPTEKDVDSGIQQIYKNASRNSYFKEQFEVDDLYNRLIQLRQQENQRVQKAEGGDMDSQMADMMEEPTHTMPDGTEMWGATHEEYEAMMPEEGMVPDEQMEDDYIDFIINEALEPEEEEYLMNVLSQDDQLSIIIDKVVDTASEFSGAGEVEGPGTPISDSIPARLSDGEFVMTAKATEKLGSDNLQGMMKQAEIDADIDDVKRQIKAAGGEVEAEKEEEAIVDTSVSGNKSVVMPSSITDRKIKESMLSLNPRNSLFTS